MAKLQRRLLPQSPRKTGTTPSAILQALLPLSFENIDIRRESKSFSSGDLSPLHKSNKSGFCKPQAEATLKPTVMPRKLLVRNVNPVDTILVDGHHTNDATR
jgi:hypothetical protein